MEIKYYNIGLMEMVASLNWDLIKANAVLRLKWLRLQYIKGDQQLKLYMTMFLRNFGLDGDKELNMEILPIQVYYALRIHQIFWHYVKVESHI